jgi:hypothetical protein
VILPFLTWHFVFAKSDSPNKKGALNFKLNINLDSAEFFVQRMNSVIKQINAMSFLLSLNSLLGSELSTDMNFI